MSDGGRVGRPAGGGRDPARGVARDNLFGDREQVIADLRR
jgi:hypothetical protein